MTLFFFQIFLTVSNNSDSIFGEDRAGGPNGILNVAPLSFFGYELPVSSEGIFNVAYLYVALAFFVVVFVALRFANASRTGRAWRSLREDPLAAELMGMPVNWLKLTAFAFGAGVAALTGTLVTALNGSVFPQTFEFPLLITVYTMVILGGAGSQAGVVIGAIGISVLLELLREPGDSRFLFYALGLLGLVGRAPLLAPARDRARRNARARLRRARGGGGDRRELDVRRAARRRAAGGMGVRMGGGTERPRRLDDARLVHRPRRRDPDADAAPRALARLSLLVPDASTWRRSSGRT